MSSFDTNIKALFTLTEQITKYDGNGNLSVSSVNPIDVVFRKFRGLYEKTSNKESFMKLFVALYGKCSKQHLACESMDDFMLWFEDQKFIIDVTTKVYFPVTVIFRKACTIARDADQAMQTSKEQEGSVGSTYPEQFMLHLFRIFADCVSPSDSIKKTATELEETLGLMAGQIPEPSDGLTNLVTMAKDVMGDMNPNLAKQSINPHEIKNALANFKSTPEMKNAMKKMLGGIKLDNAKDGKAAMMNILTQMQENATELPEAIQRSMNATVDNPTGASSSNG